MKNLRFYVYTYMDGHHPVNTTIEINPLVGKHIKNFSTEAAHEG